jgi:hypothetical protein
VVACIGFPPQVVDWFLLYSQLYHNIFLWSLLICPCSRPLLVCFSGNYRKCFLIFIQRWLWFSFPSKKLKSGACFNNVDIFTKDFFSAEFFRIKFNNLCFWRWAVPAVAAVTINFAMHSWPFRNAEILAFEFSWNSTVFLVWLCTLHTYWTSRQSFPCYIECCMCSLARFTNSITCLLTFWGWNTL